MTIIFDFNRTIYDPETRTFVPGALEALQAYAQKGIPLHLVSKKEAERADILEALGIANMFESTMFVDDKEVAIKSIVDNATHPVYVVGDYLYQDIRHGNRAGAKTVWLKRGRFADLQPEQKEDIPWRTIEHMKDLLDTID